jgi:type IX secretion system PorP/SprF family membrane protein
MEIRLLNSKSLVNVNFNSIIALLANSKALLSMKKIILVYLYIFLPVMGFSQLIATSFFRENLAAINPAIIDLEYLQYKLKNNIGVTYQDQWLGFSDDNERQFTFSGFADIIPKKSNFIWGVNVAYDQAAAFQFVQTSVRGAVRIPLFSKYHNLSVGINLGVGMNILKLRKITTADDIDPLLNISDNTNLLGAYPKAGMGLYYYYYKDGRNSFFVGVSLPNIVPMSFSYQNENTDTSITSQGYLFGYTILQHFSLQGGYRYHLGRDNYLDVSGWFKKAISNRENTNFPVQWNIFMKYHLKNIFWIGAGASVSLGTENALTHRGILAAFGVDWSSSSRGMLVQFGCTYYTDLGMLQNYSSGTPEIFVRIGRF